MKRKEHILLVSLELFNDEGEANLSAVDIANEMDISPGNLYYHYRGKEEIVVALFDRFEGAVRTLLQESINASGSVEDFIALYYALLEQIYTYRFLYRNLNDIVEKYSAIATRLKRLMKLKKAFCEASIALMVETELLDLERVKWVGVGRIAENFVIMLTYYFEYSSLGGDTPSKDEYIKACFEKIISLISPYGGESMEMSIDFVEQVIAQLTYLDNE